MPALVASDWEPQQGNHLFYRDREATFDLAWVFDWIDLQVGMWPYVGIARNLQGSAFQGTLEAHYYRPDGSLAKKVTGPLTMGGLGTTLFWGWFPLDWQLRPGLNAVQLRVVTGGAVRHLAEFPIEIRGPKGIFP